MKYLNRSLATLLLFAFQSPGVYADDVTTAPAADPAPPACTAQRTPIETFNNEEVLRWKASTPNGTLMRGYVHGKAVAPHPDDSGKVEDGYVGAGKVINGHMHFSIQIGPQPSDTLEVIYSEDFGDMKPVPIGADVIACGDYITSSAPSNGYRKSPDGAILHWVHRSTGRHDGGYVLVDHSLYGVGADHAPGKGLSAAKHETKALSELHPVAPAAHGCFTIDGNGVVMNPNFGIKGKPFRNYYGFAFDGEKVWKLETESATEAVSDAATSSFDDYLKNRLRIDALTQCIDDFFRAAG